MREDPTATPELGDILASEVKVGDVFSTSIESEEVMLEPEESVAVAVHVMVSPTLVSEVVTVYVVPVPIVVLPTVQA